MTTIAEALLSAANAVNDNGQLYKTTADALNAEISAVASNAGLDPLQNIGNRFVRAVRSGQLQYIADQSAVDGTITIQFPLAHTAYLTGLPVVVKLNRDVVGATQLNLVGLGLRPVRHNGGGDLQKLDYKKGDLVAMIYSTEAGAWTVATPVNGVIVDGNVAKTVHGANADFPDLNAAFAWLSRRRISGGVSFQLPVGVNANKIVYTSDVYFSHPDGARVTILGAPLQGPLPAGASLSFTGTSAAQRATDTVTNLTLLRNFYQTEIYFQGGKKFYGVGSLGNVQDLLFTSDGSGANIDGFFWSNGYVGVTRCAVIGAQLRAFAGNFAYFTFNGANFGLGSGVNGFAADNASTLDVRTGSLTALSSGGSGFSASLNGRIVFDSTFNAQMYSRGNAGDGATVNAGRIVVNANAISRDNAQSGFSAFSAGGSINVSGATAANNGGSGFSTNLGGYIVADNSSGSGNGQYGYTAFNGSTVYRPGGTCTGAIAASTPAVGSVGNSNSTII